MAYNPTGTISINDLFSKLREGTGISIEAPSANKIRITFTGVGGSDQLVKVDSSDTTADYLRNKLQEGAGISLSIINPAGNEKVQIKYTGTAGGTQLHGLDPSDGYHSGTLRASQVTVVDSVNYYTGTVVEDVLQEIFPLTTGAVRVRKNEVGQLIGPRKIININEGSGIGITVADHAANSEIDITITYTGTSGGGITGTGSINTVPYWTSPTNLTYDSRFSYVTGKIGIGTIIPVVSLHIQNTGTTNQELLRLGYDASDYASFTVSSQGRLTISTFTTGGAGGSSGHILFQPATTDGRVGIGSIPVAAGKLFVVNTGTQLYLGYDFNTNYGQIAVSSTGTINISTPAGPIRHITLNPGGNVGIGIINPVQTLDVAGDVKVGAYSSGRIIGRSQFISPPASPLLTGEWDLSVYDDGINPVHRVRYNDNGINVTGDLLLVSGTLVPARGLSLYDDSNLKINAPSIISFDDASTVTVSGSVAYINDKGLVPVQSFRVTGNATATITFSNIPQRFTHLMITVNSRSDASVANAPINLRFNNDSAAGYSFTKLTAGSTNVLSSGTVSATSMQMGYIPGALATGGNFGEIIGWIFDYTKKDIMKSFLGLNAFRSNKGNVGAMWLGVNNGVWGSGTVNNITRADIFSVGNLVSGSLVELYAIL